jgi:menaquinone-dependent protoporphyrinogen oxidase
MPGSIIVAYDTKNGSTAEVAEALASRLHERGYAAEARRARDVREITGDTALVVGAPIYSGHWLSGAHGLLKRVAKAAPARRPVLAVFALGPRSDDGPENWERPRAQFAHALEKHASLEPVSTALFGGADPPKKSPRRDIRDWERIHAWADELADLLGGPSDPA